MIRVRVYFAVFVLSVGSAGAAVRHRRVVRVAPRAPSGPVTVIEDVAVVDVIAGRVTPHQDVVVRGGQIATVRDAVKRGREVRYVIPGLWDMHVHLWFPQSQMAMYVANGVTGVRDMGTDLRRVREWQKEIGAGTRVGPRIYACGSPMSTVASDAEDMPVNVIRTPQEARAVFDRYYDQRVDFIKVLNLSKGEFDALAEVSRHDGIPFAGHLPWEVSAFEAAQDRMMSMEHLFGVGVACSRKENELRERGIAARDKRDSAAVRAVNAEVIRTYDPVGALALWDTFRRYEVWQTPTLSLWERMTDPERHEEGVRFVEAAVRNKWKPAAAQSEKAEADFAARLTGDMAKAGVGILAGTDTGDPWTAPGFELHHELELLVKAGLTPAQALRAATSEPAKLMRRERELGQVRAGFAADLVVLRGNPLDRIENTRNIEKVMLRGKMLDETALRSLLKP